MYIRSVRTLYVFLNHLLQRKLTSLWYTISPMFPVRLWRSAPEVVSRIWPLTAFPWPKRRPNVEKLADSCGKVIRMSHQFHVNWLSRTCGKAHMSDTAIQCALLIVSSLFMFQDKAAAAAFKFGFRFFHSSSISFVMISPLLPNPAAVSLRLSRCRRSRHPGLPRWRRTDGRTGRHYERST